jgi:DNA repair protein RecN (Recombination protein N)
VLVELVVRNLGVIDNVTVLPGPAMTALTGETGAGKTLIVGAVSLLLGARADPVMVRPGCDEARIDGRFESDGIERVLTRVVTSAGRSRAYIDGSPVTIGQLEEVGAGLVDLHGQHAHQSLLSVVAHRDALDAYGRIDRSALVEARSKMAELDRQLATLGGDERARARELDLLRFQAAEIDQAKLDDPSEDQALMAEEDLLGDALAHREAAATALAALRDDGGARDAIGLASASLHRRAPFADIEARILTLTAELEDVIAELRGSVDGIEDDPERLSEVRARRQLIRDVLRKYGDSIATVTEYRAELEARIEDLSSHEERAAAIEVGREKLRVQMVALGRKVSAARRAAASALASAIEKRLADLAMAKAQIGIEVHDHPDALGIDEGSDVRFLLSANPGSPLQPLSKVASGGELARTMLALRLALLEGRVALGGIPDTLIFDEVDAGIGGQAAVAVGAALAELGEGRQVIVVTHLPQVAARGAEHLVVEKVTTGKSTSTVITAQDRDGRIVELARMLAGHPDSDSGRRHAEELLDERPVRRVTAAALPPGEKKITKKKVAEKSPSPAKKGKV